MTTQHGAVSKPKKVIYTKGKPVFRIRFLTVELYYCIKPCWCELIQVSTRPMSHGCHPWLYDDGAMWAQIIRVPSPPLDEGFISQVGASVPTKMWASEKCDRKFGINWF